MALSTPSLADVDGADTPPTAPDAAAAPFSRASVLAEYRLGWESRHFSLLGRREVLTGKAKFGIFGDGKEVAQLAMARAFRRGDFRSGYYRDQTFMLAIGGLTLEQMFAQLYADPDVVREPCSAGRQMTAHFATCFLDAQGRFLDLTGRYNSTADVSPTAAQMPRLVGLAYASRLFRELPDLASRTQLSRGGEEIAWGTIGNASCAEGLFWESINAVGVLRAPMLLSVWDDGYGISVPNELQVAKGDLSALLAGFRRAPGGDQGYDLHTVCGWDYPTLCRVYQEAAETVRREHVPAILHVVELTQPLGHSTSGSHERYKPKDRLAWETEHDCLRRMREWILAEGFAGAAELDTLEEEAKVQVRECQRRAWEDLRGPIDAEKRRLLDLAGKLAGAADRADRAERGEIEQLAGALERQPMALRRDLLVTAEALLLATWDGDPAGRRELLAWKREQEAANRERYNSHLYSESPQAALAVPAVPAVYAADSPVVNGFEVLNACFDAALARRPEFVAMGEDLGQLGDVNQGFAGLQAKYGPLRVSDTGIREATIMGQAIGMAMRGLRPLAEIQYLDYILYALQILSDDLASLRYRTKGQQKAPVLLRSRGHRLEGVWHSGSPMAGILNLLRGLYVCVPRNMTQAAGFYNTLLAGDDPGLVVEVLNGYRVKERLPANVGEFTLPLGVPEVLRPGSDVTVVTYGALCRIALEAAELLARVGIEIELIDVQTLLPFDLPGRIGESLQKTSRVLFLDEDVPGGATAYMVQQVLEVQGGFTWLDAPPRTLTAAPHRPAYGSDGDYFSKPNRESIFEAVYEMMHEADPAGWPIFFR
ncbi:MAG TPA: thiamine pyrophosphate-dependent enzyme [Thermoanaerobaculia bacterium]|nr:thiamine pyrophosphate-dependent enzyme [Thermoanaerobaculia bacterium]